LLSWTDVAGDYFPVKIEHVESDSSIESVSIISDWQNADDSRAIGFSGGSSFFRENSSGGLLKLRLTFSLSLVISGVRQLWRFTSKEDWRTFI